MFTYEERLRAVELYIACGCKVNPVLREFGYPSPNALRSWHKEFIKTGELRKAVTHKSRFSPDQIEQAVTHYLQNGCSYTGTSRALGYPSRNILKQWVESSQRRITSTDDCTSASTVVNYTEEEKRNIILEWVSGTPDYKLAAENGVSRATIYNWKKKYISDGGCSAMPRKKVEQIETLETLKDEVAAMKAQRDILEKELTQMRFEQKVMETTIEVLKKAEGINLENLTNSEKVDVIDALKKDYRLKPLLDRFKISKSSYYYSKNAKLSPDKYMNVRITIRTLFEDHRKCYGYRRIHALLKRSGVHISEKVIRRLMYEECLRVYRPKRRKYSSYAGEIDSAPENIVARKFHTDKPNELWLTDITEFALPAGKVYLSPLIDCFDGMAVSWTIGKHPTAELANTMLDNAIAQLKEGTYPVIHSDRGGHYRWPNWVERIEKANLTRSMSRKGCSGDNAACEGFFGRIKNEMFYGRSWTGVTIESFIEELDEYLRWYNEERIKLSLGAMSPIQYRQRLGLN